MPTVNVQVHFPGRWADDPRTSVTFVESEYPDYPITLHYLRVQVDNGAIALFNVGVEIGDRFKVQPGNSEHPIGKLPKRRLDPKVLSHVLQHYSSFDTRARGVLEGSGDPGGPLLEAEKPRRRRRDMTPDRLKVLLEEYREYERADRSPLKELANDYGVNVSTVSRWMTKARALKKGETQ